MKRLARLLVLISMASIVSAQMRVMELPNNSPLIAFRIVFTAGSAADPASKPGLAYLTASMISDGSTKTQTYRQIEDALFPMAASFDSQVDKEMTTFVGETHADNLEAYYKLIRGMLLDPGWREEDFKRVKDNAINGIKSGLRNNDEELAKEVLYSDIYQGMPYGHYSMGTVTSLEAITLDDVKQFYKSHYVQTNLILGVSGSYKPAFLERMKKDFRQLPLTAGFRPRRTEPGLIDANRAVIVEKDTRAVAMSIGFPISVTRQNPDYPALLVASSYLGQHRMSGGVLYDEMREKRGLNYGDYSYIEYFPRGMYRMEPDPNLVRRYHIFQIWIRPVQPANAKFALRLALYELAQSIKNGISPDGFAMTRDFLTKYVNVLARTQSAQLGFAIDDMYLDRPNFNQTLQVSLASLTVADVNRVIRRYLRTEPLAIVAVCKDGEGLKRELASDDASPMTYNSAKPASVTDVDKIVESWPLHLKAENIRVVGVDSVFQ